MQPLQMEPQLHESWRLRMTVLRKLLAMSGTRALLSAFVGGSEIQTCGARRQS